MSTQTAQRNASQITSSPQKRQKPNFSTKDHKPQGSSGGAHFRLQADAKEHHGIHNAAKEMDMQKVFTRCQEVLKNEKIVHIPAGQTLEQTVIDIHGTRENQEPFYVVDLASPVRMYEMWKKLLPRVIPHYAVKTNGDLGILTALTTCGISFDCASPMEMDLVLRVGGSPDKIIYANTVKNIEYIKLAHEKGVRRMTFDNEEEIGKIMQNCPGAELVLRVCTDDSPGGVSEFSTKFGASVPEARRLVRLCKDQNANLIGMEVHVGSSCKDPKLYDLGLERIKEVFDYAKEQGFNMHLIDLGGGWPGADFELSDDAHPTTDETEAQQMIVNHLGAEGLPPFPVFAAHVNRALDRLFPKMDLEICAEPGRYYATAATTLACSVIARRPQYSRAPKDNENQMPPDTIAGWKYYLSDGAYGSMSTALTEQHHPVIHVLFSKNSKVADTSTWKKSTFYGPTCDGKDMIQQGISFPELQIGDWVYIRLFGAYTQSLITRFNGFPPPYTHYVMTMDKSFFESKSKRE